MRDDEICVRCAHREPILPGTLQPGRTYIPTSFVDRHSCPGSNVSAIYPFMNDQCWEDGFDCSLPQSAYAAVYCTGTIVDDDQPFVGQRRVDDYCMQCGTYNYSLVS